MVAEELILPIQLTIMQISYGYMTVYQRVQQKVVGMYYRCIECDKTYPIESRNYRCECQGLLAFHHKTNRFDFSSLRQCPDWSLWRYRSALPVFDEHIIDSVSMHEGCTAMIRLEDHLYGKAEYLMPTLSFKDRGAVLLACLMKSLSVSSCIVDSSGNAGTAIAAYCARADIACSVYVPESTSSAKTLQAESYGATVHRIGATREETAVRAQEALEISRAFYASHVYNPIFFEGTKTYLYEIFEQMDYRLPDMLFVPVGNGTLLFGIAIALQELFAWRLIEKFPLVVGVQASQCAPLALRSAEEVCLGTVAEGIAIAKPPREKEMIQLMGMLHGIFVHVSEEQIVQAQHQLGLKGCYVEPTSAVCYAAYRTLIETHPDFNGLTAVVPLCSTGLKTLH